MNVQHIYLSSSSSSSFLIVGGVSDKDVVEIYCSYFLCVQDAD
jgi:hypothetical protein